MIKAVSNNAMTIEVTVEGETYVTVKEYNPVKDIIYQIEQQEEIILGSVENHHIHIKTDDVIEIFKKNNLIKKISYSYEKARTEIIVDLKEQADVFSIRNYFSIQSFPDDMKEKYLKRNIIRGVKEKIENLQ